MSGSAGISAVKQNMAESKEVAWWWGVIQIKRNLGIKVWRFVMMLALVVLRDVFVTVMAQSRCGTLIF